MFKFNLSFKNLINLKWFHIQKKSKIQIDLTVCCRHVTYAFQSESTHYSCLNVKELLLRSRRKIWNLSDCNWTRTQNHLVRRWALNHLAKWSSCLLSTYLYGAFDCMLLSCHVCCHVCHESTLYSCLNVKELLTQSRRKIASPVAVT